MPANTTDQYTWNDAPPRGHPMEGKEKFPGPLYPPSAAPAYTPSKKTPFAKAVKRAMAHIGAWPWDPDSWDEAWSDAAANGVEGNVNKAGMKKVQVWSGTLDPTGFVGEKTYNFLRSALIPQSRTNAGNPVWDSVCQNLTQQALDQQAPPPAPAPPPPAIREQALKLFIAKIGVKESPANSNLQEFGAEYGENGVPWCAISATIVYLRAGHPPGKTFQTVKQAGQNDRWDYVPYLVSDARNGRFGLSVTSSPIPGDLVAYNFGGSASASEWEFDHVGLFEEWVGGHTFNAIEGNTSMSGSQSNGGEVCRRQRDVNGQGTVFIRVREP